MTLEPGPELDARVAKAIGTQDRTHDWQLVGCNRYGTAYYCAECRDTHMDDTEPPNDNCRVPYSTDANAALSAAESCEIFTDYPLQISFYDNQWCVDNNSHIIGHEATFALSICAAILALKEKPCFKS